MALLAFHDPRASPVGALMELAQRQKTASELNAAILVAQVRMGLGRRAWAGSRARAACCRPRGLLVRAPPCTPVVRGPTATQAQEHEPRLPMLLRLLHWAQEQLAQAGVRYPSMPDPASAQLVEPS